MVSGGTVTRLNISRREVDDSTYRRHYGTWRKRRWTSCTLGDRQRSVTHPGFSCTR